MSADTPLNSIKRDWCPRARKYCFCQTGCVARSDEEIERASRAEHGEPYPRARVKLKDYVASVLFVDDLDGCELAEA